MNCDRAVISVKPKAYLRRNAKEPVCEVPYVTVLTYILFFLVGMLVYNILSPSLSGFRVLLLERFVSSVELEWVHLPENIPLFLNFYRIEMWLLCAVFLSALTFLSPFLCGFLCIFRGLQSGLAVAHAFAVWKSGLLFSPIFLSFLCKEGIFCAILIFFCMRSVTMASRLSTMGKRHFLMICRDLLFHFVKILFAYLVFLIAVGIICFTI